MNPELHFLHALLIAAIGFAPLVTSRFFLESTRLHDAGHVVAGVLTAAALLWDVPALTVLWLLFCAFAFVLFLRERIAHLRSPYELAKCVPFMFSIIGATWLVSGANGLGLLGYGKDFSFYAALHSHVLGWMIIGGIAALANDATRYNRFFLAAVFVSLASFLLIAFGIDGVPTIKPIGVAGITLMVGASLLLFLVTALKSSRLGFGLGLLSLVGFILTMTLAWQNELGVALAPFLGTRSMVSLHGVVNGLIVAPCFVLAVYLATRSDG